MMRSMDATQQVTRRHNGTAITSLIAGIIAFATIVFTPPTGATYTIAVIGLAFGLIAAAQARVRPSTMGLWIAGISLNLLTLIIGATLN